MTDQFQIPERPFALESHLPMKLSNTGSDNEVHRTRQNVPITLGVAGDPRIIDLTAKADKSKRYLIRDPQKVYALVLHQMACCYNVSDPLTRYPQRMSVHFVILPDGRILQLHPIQALTGASNGFNNGSVAVEFAGNFPDTKGKWWIDQEDVNAIRARLKKQKVSEAQIQARIQAYRKANQNQVTPQQIEAGRYLVRYLIRVLAPARGLTHILAHRQSYHSRENDPGPDVWYHVGQWAVENLGLKDGGSGFKVDSGNPIPDTWRNWGRRTKQPELMIPQSFHQTSSHFQSKWDPEVNSRSPVTSGGTFSVLPTSASGPFKGWVWPMPVWNGRQPVITSGFDPSPSPDPRFSKKHGGVDILYVRLPHESSNLPEGVKSRNPRHPGYFVPSNTIPVFAVGAGVVIQSGKNFFGHSVIIDHGNGYRSFYQHLTAQDLPTQSTRVAAGTPIGFVGHNPAPGGYPLNHLHFEVWPGGVPARSIDPAQILKGASIPSNVPVIVPTTPSSTSGPASETLRRAIKQGIRDENRLTDMIFQARHPELIGRRIRPEERQLVKEWLDIRNRLVRPALQASSTALAPGPDSVPAAQPGTKVSDALVRQTLAIAESPVPKLGITLEQLLQRHQAEAGSIPIEVLLAFISREAGHHLFTDATAGYNDRKTGMYVPSPKFYELGVFQTPAGLHGCVPEGTKKRCSYGPPGLNVKDSPFGQGWYRLTQTYPTTKTWQNPTMQVRIGLWSLTSTGERVAGNFPELFVSKSSEWYLRMAVLYSFAAGSGWTNAFLKKYRNELLALPESQRWDFLTGKEAYFQGRDYSRTIKFEPKNVDEKMALAAKLRAVRGVTH